MEQELFKNIDVVGIYGAIVATLVFLWELIKAYLNRKRVIVCGNHQLLQLEGGQWTNCPVATVTNKSDWNCDIQSIYFISQSGNIMMHARNDLPKKLESGCGYSFQFHKEHLGDDGYKQTLNCKRIAIQTTDNKTWKSKLFPYHNGWLLGRWWKSRQERSK